MATTAWTGLGDGTSFLGDNDNWSGSAPTSSDTVIIASTSSAIAGEVSSLTGITLKVGPGFTGTIGSSGTPLDIDGGVFDFESNGSSCYITGTWTTVQVNGGAGGANWFNWEANASTAITTLRVLDGNGTVTIGAGATCATVEQISAAGVTLNLNHTTMTTLTANSGIINALCGITTLDLRGNAQMTMTGSGGTITTLDLTGDARLAHKSGGTITTLNGYAGVLDGTENPNATVTVTNCTIWDATINCQSGLKNYVFTNPISIQGSGQILPSLGQTLTVA